MNAVLITCDSMHHFKKKAQKIEAIMANKKPPPLFVVGMF
jgi:hypothetical protein